METKNAEMQRVMERLERVERQNRWLLRGGLAAVLMCGSVLLMAQKPLTRSIEAEKFVLKDAAGKVRAELHMTPAGPELALYSGLHPGPEVRLSMDKDEPGLGLIGVGSGGALLSVGKDGPGLTLTGTGSGAAFLDANKDDIGLRLLGFGSGGRLEAELTKDGPSLQLRDAGHGNAQALLNVSGNGPNLRLDGAEGQGVAQLAVEKDATVLGLLGQGSTATSLWNLQAAVDKDGPALVLRDLDGFAASIGNTRLMLPTTGEKSQTSAASIHLFDSKGKILWSAP